MAREESVHERSSDEAEDDNADLLNRRSYLGLAGAAVASVATLNTAGTASAATRVNIVEEGADNTGSSSVNNVLESVQGDNVEVYFPPGEYKLDPISLSGSNWSLVGEDATLVVPSYVNRRWLYLGGNGWTIDGFTVDLTASGAAPVNYLRGSNWEFKNVEFVGQMSDPQYRADSDLMYPAVGSSSGTGLIENVVATDGSADVGESSNRGLAWFGQNNAGELTWRGCHFAGWANNTLYGANSAGKLVIEGCTFENTNVGVRIGGNTVVRDCVWKQDGRVPAQRWTGDSNGRGLWINSNQHTSGDILVEGCEFAMTGPDATSAINASNSVDNLTIRNTRIQQSNGRSAVALPGSGSLTVEQVSVTGDSSAAAFNIDNRDGSTFTGVCVDKPGTGIHIANSRSCRVSDSTIACGGNAFNFQNSSVDTSGISRSGSCPAPNLSGDGSSTTDGSSGSDSSGNTTTDGSDTTDSSQSLSNTLTVRGSGTATNYEFSIDGELAANPNTGSLEGWDSISGTSAAGWVTQDTDVDSYRFSGSVSDFTFIQGDARIFLNGEEVTADDIVSSSSLPRTITIRGSGTTTKYEFASDGELKANPEVGDLQQWDSIDGSSAQGWVTDSEHVDSYQFSGSITQFSFLRGEAEVTVDGTKVDPSTFPESSGSADGSSDGPAVPDLPHRLVIGQPDSEVTNTYKIQVDDEVAKSEENGATIEAEDTISGTTVDGSVSGDVDAYRFSGSIVNFQLDGTARVNLSRNA